MRFQGHWPILTLQGAYFGRDDIAYRGASKFFMKASEEEREHALKFVEYLNKRGGKAHFKQLYVSFDASHLWFMKHY